MLRYFAIWVIVCVYVDFKKKEQIVENFSCPAQTVCSHIIYELKYVSVYHLQVYSLIILDL